MKTTHTYYLIFLDQESGHSSLVSLLRISRGCNESVSQTAFSPRRSAWERWSSKISAVVRKIQLPAIVRLMSKFSSWLLPHFLGASQSLAPRPSLLPFFKWQLTFSKPEEERQLFSSGMAPFSKCFQLIKSGPPRITYFRLVQTNRFRTVY